MGDREERLARNEVLFREVNERVREISESLAAGRPTPVLEIFCECGQSDCVDKLAVPTGDYEAARAHPERFLIANGHEELAVEDVVQEEDGYAIVEKHEEEAALAREHDPRG